MAELQQQPQIILEVRLVLEESEARALEALTGYDVNAFLEFFYRNMGKTYLQPHEAGLRSLFKAVRGTIPGILNRTDAARQTFVASTPET